MDISKIIFLYANKQRYLKSQILTREEKKPTIFNEEHVVLLNTN